MQLLINPDKRKDISTFTDFILLCAENIESAYLSSGMDSEDIRAAWPTIMSDATNMAARLFAEKSDINLNLVFNGDSIASC